jgi:hypothetical protein
MIMMLPGEGSSMADGRGYEIVEATYPLIPEVTEAGVTIPEEIRCLLDAGWTWDGDKLVHPQDKGLWRMYKRVDSPQIGSPQRLDAEIEQAVRAARQRAQRIGCGTTVKEHGATPSASGEV